MKLINNTLILKPLFTLIHRFECVKRYEGGREWESPNTWDARNHINWGAILSILTSLTGFIHPLFLLSYIAAYLYHAPLMELVFQYHKEQDKPLWNVCAQIWERQISFMAFLPLPIAVLVFTLVTKFYLFNFIF